jgi:Toastrack DUF4097
MHRSTTLHSILRTIAIVAVVATISSSAVFASVEKDTIKRSFTVEPGGTLYLDIDRGDVTVLAVKGRKVIVEMDRLTNLSDSDDVKRVLSRHEWDIELDGDDVVIESRYENERSRRRRTEEFRLTVTVKVPLDYNVEFSTGAGTVDISDLSGYVDGETGAGNIRVGEIDGDVSVRAGSGNIHIEGVTGGLEVQSGAGNIDLGFVGGETEATTGAGNIIARIVRQPRDDSRLESGAGNVTVYLDDNIGMTVDAKSSVGSADCDFGLEVAGRWMSKSFGGRVNGGGPDLTLRSGVGNVSLLRF